MGDQKPGVGGVPLPGQDLRPKNSVFPRGLFKESINFSRIFCEIFKPKVVFFYINVINIF